MLKDWIALPELQSFCTTLGRMLMACVIVALLSCIQQAVQ